MTFTKEMLDALEADGEKLQQLTGKDHGPWSLEEAILNDNARDAWLGEYTLTEPTASGATEFAVYKRDGKYYFQYQFSAHEPSGPEEGPFLSSQAAHAEATSHEN